MTVRLFLDVDGVINADQPQGWGPTKEGRAAAYGSDSWRIRWAPRMVEKLFSLGMELTWATTWKNYAPASIAPLIGHGAKAGWLEAPPEPRYGYSGYGSIPWKFAAIQLEDLSGGFVWIDDEIGEGHKAWAVEQGGLAVRPKHRTGISIADIEAVEEYLNAR